MAEKKKARLFDELAQAFVELTQWKEGKITPEALRGRRFYKPTERGYEKTIGERMRWIESLRRPAAAATEESNDSKTENDPV